MKKLFSLFLVGLLLLVFPSSIFANHSVWLTSPTNGFSTTDSYPSFYFDYNSNSEDDWAILEVATSPDVGSDSEFLFDNVEIFSMIDYPQKWYRSSFKKLSPGTYYWHVLVRSLYGGYFHSAVSEIRTLYVVNPTPPPATPPPPATVTPAPAPAPAPVPVATPKKVQKKKVVSGFHKKKCKNKKFHASHCKSSSNKKQNKKNKTFHKKKCSKVVIISTSSSTHLRTDSLYNIKR